MVLEFVIFVLIMFTLALVKVSRYEIFLKASPKNVTGKTQLTLNSLVILFPSL